MTRSAAGVAAIKNPGKAPVIGLYAESTNPLSKESPKKMTRTTRAIGEARTTLLNLVPHSTQNCRMIGKWAQIRSVEKDDAAARKRKRGPIWVSPLAMTGLMRCLPAFSFSHVTKPWLLKTTTK